MVIDGTRITEEESQARKELIYEWKAYYKDGTELKQYDDDTQTTYHFGHIDQDKIYAFEIAPRTSNKNLQSIQVNLETGLFYINNEPITGIYQGDKSIEIGMPIYGRFVTSSWGNKAKLIYVRHMRRDFAPSPVGFLMNVSVIYELGWEADVDGKHEKHTIEIDDNGRISIPATFEQEGFVEI